jgi:hypothetical protein
MPRLLIAALAVSVSLLAASPSVAHAATPCWKQVINDWTADGQINGHYSPHCLRQAIKNTPEDLRDYSSIDDDINAALIGTLTLKNGTNAGGGPGTNGGGSGTNGGGSNPGKLNPKEAKKRAEQAVPHAGTAQSIPADTSTIPLPLLIMAGIAAAALLAAASPPLIQRLRARFPHSRAGPQTDRS